MATISKIENLLVWQESRVLVKDIYEITQKHCFSREFFLKDQIKRSAISVMSNVGERFGRGGNKEFVQFLFMENGSPNELKSQLYISLDLKLITSDELNNFLLKTNKLENMLKSFIRKIRDSKYTGTKFKQTI